VEVHPLPLRVGDVGRVERLRELTWRGELGSCVDVEDKRRVLHGEHVEPVAHDEWRHIDFVVDDEFADLFEPRNVRGREDRFEPVPALAGVVDANGPHIDRLDQRC
jgi:hypothetical protein